MLATWLHCALCATNLAAHSMFTRPSILMVLMVGLTLSVLLEVHARMHRHWVWKGSKLQWSTHVGWIGDATPGLLMHRVKSERRKRSLSSHRRDEAGRAREWAHGLMLMGLQKAIDRGILVPARVVWVRMDHLLNG